MDNKYVPYIFIGLLVVLIVFLLSIPNPKPPINTSVQDMNIVINNHKIDSLRQIIAKNDLVLDSLHSVYAKKKVQIIIKYKEREKQVNVLDTVGVDSITSYIRANFARQY